MWAIIITLASIFQSWNDVASKFNKLKFCTHEGDMVLNRTDMVALSVPFDMTVPYSDVWNNFSLISGSVSASDLVKNINLEYSSQLIHLISMFQFNYYSGFL